MDLGSYALVAFECVPNALFRCLCGMPLLLWREAPAQIMAHLKECFSQLEVNVYHCYDLV